MALPKRHQLQFTPSSTFNPNTKYRRDCPPRSYPSVTSTPSEMSTPHEPGMGMWSSPVQHGLKPRPATIHETIFPGYCMPEEYNNGLPAWDSSTMPMQPTHDGLPHQYSIQQDFYGSNLGNSKRARSVTGVYFLADSLQMAGFKSPATMEVTCRTWILRCP